MADGEDRVASSRGPLLYGLIAIVVGVAGAIIFGLTVGGGTSPAAATASPPQVAAGSAASSAVASALQSASSPVASPTALDSVLSSATPGPAPTSNPTPKPTTRPTPNTNPAFVSVTIPKTEDCTGSTAGTIQISWKIANASGVTLAIDGPGLFDSYEGRSRAVDVPFACSHQQLSHTYTLTTTGGSGPAARVKRTVTAAKPQIKTFVLGQPACPGIVGITFQYAVAGATGVQLERDGAIYGTYSGKTSSDGLTVQYDCSKGPQTFVLTTTGGYGTEATTERVVQPPSP